MGEKAAVEAVSEPLSSDILLEEFRELGVEAGDRLIVHSSMTEIGWVAGGPQAVVDALQRAVTESGTLVVPTHTPQYSNPEQWENPPVPDDWIDLIPRRMSPFRRDVTPSYGVGKIPECLRTYPGAVRSRHPEVSFAAWGADAEEIVADHSYDYGLGEESPLADLYDRDATILLLGVGHNVNTSLHLAEYRAEFPTEPGGYRAPVLVDGERRMVEYNDIETSTDDFEELGSAFESEVGLTEDTVGAATAKLADQPEMVDFAVEFFESNRPLE